MAVSRKVLVIEDDDDMRAMLAHLIPQWGFTVVAAANGAAGLEMARKERPDLILCDVYMPRLSGWEVALALQTDTLLTDIPLIFLSSAADTEVDSRRLRQVGIRSYVTKGDFRALRQAIYDVLAAG